jgi:hypothetical protein
MCDSAADETIYDTAYDTAYDAGDGSQCVGGAPVDDERALARVDR